MDCEPCIRTVEPERFVHTLTGLVGDESGTAELAPVEYEVDWTIKLSDGKRTISGWVTELEFDDIPTDLTRIQEALEQFAALCRIPDRRTLSVDCPNQAVDRCRKDRLGLLLPRDGVTSPRVRRAASLLLQAGERRERQRAHQTRVGDQGGRLRSRATARHRCVSQKKVAVRAARSARERLALGFRRA